VAVVVDRLTQQNKITNSKLSIEMAAVVSGFILLAGCVN